MVHIRALEGWKNAANDDTGKIMKELGKEVLTGVIRSRVYTK